MKNGTVIENRHEIFKTERSRSSRSGFSWIRIVFGLRGFIQIRSILDQIRGPYSDALRIEFDFQNPFASWGFLSDKIY